MVLLLLSVAVLQLPGQQTETGRKPFEEIKAKAEAGDPNYESQLGIRYAFGKGVAKDEVEAYKWFLLAAAQGDEDAKTNMAIAERRLTREQIAEGLKQARNFKPHAVPSVGDERAP